MVPAVFEPQVCWIPSAGLTIWCHVECMKGRRNRSRVSWLFQKRKRCEPRVVPQRRPLDICLAVQIVEYYYWWCAPEKNKVNVYFTAYTVQEAVDLPSMRHPTRQWSCISEESVLIHITKHMDSMDETKRCVACMKLRSACCSSSLSLPNINRRNIMNIQG